MANNYTQPPPSYPSNNKLSSVAPDEEAQQPLLSSHAGPSAGFGGYYDEPLAGDVPDDFKVNNHIVAKTIQLKSCLVWYHSRRQRSRDQERFRAQGLHYPV